MQLWKKLRNILRDLWRRLRTEHRCALFRVCVSETGAKDLDPRPICRRAAALPAPTPGYPYAMFDRDAPELIGQPRFADSRLAAYQEQMAMTRGHIAQTRAQFFQLSLAPHERARQPRFAFWVWKCHGPPP
jgi:hypothetical protein